MEVPDWNTQQDYRQRVTLADIDANKNNAEDWQVCARSVGTFVLPDTLIPIDNSDIRKGFHIKLPTISFSMNISFRATMDQGPQKVDLGGYKFINDTCFGESSCYHLGDGIVATAGHAIDGRGSIKPKMPNQWYIVFGATDEYCLADQKQQAVLPASKVFVFERILYKQNQRGADPMTDDLDWALIKIHPLFPDFSKPSPFPPPLSVLKPPASYIFLEGPQNIFALGHPWGTSLKLTDPSKVHLSRGLIATVKDANDAPYQLQTTVRHSLLNHPGNSGGPLFMRSNQGTVVIGTTVANGQSQVSNLGQYGMNWDKPSKSVRINIPSTEAKDWKGFNIATRVDLWYQLIAPDANIHIVYQFTPAPKSSGTFQILLQVLYPTINGDKVEGVPFTSLDITDGAATPKKIRVTQRFSNLLKLLTMIEPPTVAIKPCFLVGVETSYLFGGNALSTVMPPKSDGTLDLITISVTGLDGGAPSSDIVILREKNQPVNNLIDRPPSLDRAWKSAARDDEVGAVDG